MLHVTTSTANFLFNGAWVILSQQHCNTPFNKWSWDTLMKTCNYNNVFILEKKNNERRKKTAGSFLFFFILGSVILKWTWRRPSAPPRGKWILIKLKCDSKSMGNLMGRKRAEFCFHNTARFVLEQQLIKRVRKKDIKPQTRL